MPVSHSQPRPFSSLVCAGKPATEALYFLYGLLGMFASVSPANAVTNYFFNASQSATVVSSNITAITVQSGAYQFTYSADGYWSASPGGEPTGRFFSVFWPNGVQAQAITAGPTVGTGANITLKRTDGQPFELRSFTGKLLANTAGAGGSFEIMPQLNGQDAFQDPLMYDATGYAGNTFTHTPALSGYDTYTIHLWVDYALIELTVADASTPPVLDISFPASKQVRLSWPTNSSGYSLQQNSSLDPANWTVVTNIAGISGSNYELTLPRESTKDFFRLILP